MFGTILDDFGMDARVMTLWYFLQGIIEICLCQNKKRSIAGAPRDEMKSVDLPEFIRNPWFLYDFSMSARTRNLKIFR